jgi:hypothetical protein
MREKPGKSSRTEATYGNEAGTPASPGKTTRAEERYGGDEDSQIGAAEVDTELDQPSAPPGGGAGGGGGADERPSRSPLDDAPLLGFMDQATEHEDLGLRPSAEEARWERDLGRKLSEVERVALARSGVDLSTLDLTGDGRPPLDHAFGTFEEAQAYLERQNRALDALRADPDTAELVRDRQAVLFAVMYWSPQAQEAAEGERGEGTGGGVEYRARPGAATFDYGFWSEASQSFWMARHDQPGMAAYQTPRERLTEAHGDFDRVLFCVSMATAHDPAAAAVEAAVGTVDGAAVDRK